MVNSYEGNTPGYFDFTGYTSLVLRTHILLLSKTLPSVMITIGRRSKKRRM